jgi:hypothetical protein
MKKKHLRPFAAFGIAYFRPPPTGSMEKVNSYASHRERFLKNFPSLAGHKIARGAK